MVESVNEEKMAGDISDSEADKSDASGEGEYEVEKILKVRKVRGINEFLVRWKNYAPSYDSWEPEANLEGAKDAMEAFLARQKNQGSANSKASARGKKRPSGPQSSQKPKMLANTSKQTEDSDEEMDKDEEHREISGDDDEEFQPAKKIRGKGDQKSAKKSSLTENSTVKQKQFASPLVRNGSTYSKSPIPTPSGQAKAVHTRMSMNQNISWLDSDDDHSDSEERNTGQKKGGQEKKVADKLANGEGINEQKAEKSVKNESQKVTGKSTESPPPPVDPDASANDQPKKGNETLVEENGHEFSEHDPVKIPSALRPRNRSGSRGSAASGPRTRKTSGNKSRTNTPLVNGTNVGNNGAHSVEEKGKHTKSEAKQQLTTTRSINSRNNSKSISNKQEGPMINFMYRDAEGNLQLFANSKSTNIPRIFPINANLEKKLNKCLGENLEDLAGEDDV